MSCRLLPFLINDGPTNMAIDETLLESAVSGTASLRCYGWSPPTLSLGYFQPSRVPLPDVPWVRRPSGGGAIMHHHEVTYCLALPAGSAWQSRRSWLLRMHEIIAAALRELGVAAMPHSEPEVQPPCRSCLCFQHFTAGDLMIDQFKVVGSAQRRIRRALMQHGSILPATSPHTPMLPGIRELSGRELSPSELGSVMQHTFSRQTDWPLITSDRTQGEKRRIEELSHDKYAHDTWNSRR